METVNIAHLDSSKKVVAQLHSLLKTFNTKRNEWGNAVLVLQSVGVSFLEPIESFKSLFGNEVGNVPSKTWYRIRMMMILLKWLWMPKHFGIQRKK